MPIFRVITRRRSAVPLIALLGLLLAACGSSGSGSSSGTASSGSSSTFKTGWIYDGSISDKGYDQSWYQGQQAFVKSLGGSSAAPTTLVQNEPYTSQMTSTAQSMVGAGAKMLIDPAAGGTLFYKACQASPSVACIEANGVPPFPSNVEALYLKNWQAAYLEGMAAGYLTKSGVIGFIAGFMVPAPIEESINALALGCQRVHHGCKVDVSVANSWYDPPKETEIANALIDSGADVIASGNNDAVAVQVAQKRHVWGIGAWGDVSSSGPDAFITSQVVNWAPALVGFAKEVKAGKFKGGGVDLLGFGQGMQLAPWGEKVPQSVRTKVDATMTQIQAGKNVFVGPISDNKGKLRVPAGSSLSDSYIYSSWNWLVKGVSTS